MATKRISQLTQTATEADLKAGNYLALDGVEGTKRLPAEAVAKAGDVGVLEDVVTEKKDASWSNINYLTFDNDGLVKSTTTAYQMKIIPMLAGEKLYFEFDNNGLFFGFALSDDTPSVGGHVEVLEYNSERASKHYSRAFAVNRNTNIILFAYATTFASATRKKGVVGNSFDSVKNDVAKISEGIDGKADKNPPNLFRESDATWDKYFDATGNERSADGGNYGVTTFYVLPPEGLSYKHCGISTFANAVVYDENKTKVKVLGESLSFYQPESGEKYIRFLIMKTRNYPFQVNTGSDLKPSGNVYSQLGNQKSSLSLVENGEINFLRTTDGLNGESYGVVDHYTSSCTLTRNSSGAFDSWAHFSSAVDTGDGVYNADTSKKLIVEYDFEIVTPENGTYHTFWITNGAINTQGEYQKVATYNESGHVYKEFDLAYYAQYKGWTKFNFWFAFGSIGQSGLHQIVIKNLKVYQRLGMQEFSNFGGSNVGEILRGVDDKFNELIGNKSEYVVSPNGQKFTLSVDDSGNTFGIPLYPKKASFIGNSLIRGNATFGMNASQSDKDYYYLIGNFISGKRSDFVQNRIYGSNLEHSETLAAARTNITAIVDEIPSDADLVSIQMGDNVNTDTKRDVFDTSCGEFISAIRTKAPRAKVIWFGIWYGNTRVYSRIQTECAAKGVQFINIGSLNTRENQSFIGAIINRGVVENRTLSDVTNVTANTANNITATFVVGGNSYTSQLDVESYSLAGTTLSYRSQYLITSSSGVATHPGDNGFRLIANKVLYSIGMTDDEEYYKE